MNIILIVFGGSIFVLTLFIGVMVLITKFRTSYDIYKEWVGRTQYGSESIKLDRKTIKDLYVIAPQRWELVHNYGVTFLKYQSDCSYSAIYIYTNFWDYLWLNYQIKKYRKQVRLQKEAEIRAKTLKKIIKTSQNDISKHQELAAKEMKTALIVQKEVMGRLASK